MTLLPELKTEYNRQLKRAKKAAEYMDNQTIPIEVREKWAGKYRDIIRALNELIEMITVEGYDMTDDEKENGFKL